MFSLKESNRRMFSRNVMAKLSISALFGALCVLPACSINAHDKQNSKDGEAHVDIKSPLPSFPHDTGLDISSLPL